MKKRHVFELLGKTKVEVNDGEIEVIKESDLSYCPLWEKVRDFKTVKEKAKEQIRVLEKEIGFCTEERIIEPENPVLGFGATETFMTAMEKGNLDAAVTICEGAGTVIVPEPRMVQGIGGRLSGIIETSEIKSTIDKIEKKGGHVLPEPEINQVKGVKYAKELGYNNIGVTVANLDDAKRCKEIDRENIINFGVHLTGMNDEEIKEIIKYLDLASACASKTLRELAQEKSNLQVGEAVQIFTFTQKGKELILERAKDIDQQLYLNKKNLPILDDFDQPDPLI